MPRQTLSVVPVWRLSRQRPEPGAARLLRRCVSACRSCGFGGRPPHAAPGCRRACRPTRSRLLAVRAIDPERSCLAGLPAGDRSCGFDGRPRRAARGCRPGRRRNASPSPSSRCPNPASRTAGSGWNYRFACSGSACALLVALVFLIRLHVHSFTEFENVVLAGCCRRMFLGSVSGDTIMRFAPLNRYRKSA